MLEPLSVEELTNDSRNTEEGSGDPNTTYGVRMFRNL